MSLLMFDDAPLPSFSANFLSGALPPGLTYTNSSTTRYYWNASGSLATAAANEGIFEYDPLTLALKGMRWEMEQRTNNVLYSSENNAAWAAVSSTITSSGVSVVPGKTPMLVTASFANGRATQAIGTLTGTTECVYAIAEQGTGATSRVMLFDGTTSSIVAQCTITWATEAISGAGTYGATKLKAAGPNGGKLFLLWASGTGTAGNIRRYNFYPDQTAGTGTAYLHHAQLEAGASPSSPIITTSAAVVRQPDLMPAITVAPWYNLAAGTFVFEGICADNTAARGMYVIHDGSNNNRIFASVETTGAARFYGNSNGTMRFSMNTSNTTPIGAVFRHVGAVEVNNAAASLNGGAIVSDTYLLMPLAATSLQFGYLAVMAAGSAFMGYARRFSYYNTRLPNAILQGLSRV